MSGKPYIAQRICCGVLLLISYNEMCWRLRRQAYYYLHTCAGVCVWHFILVPEGFVFVLSGTRLQEKCWVHEGWAQRFQFKYMEHISSQGTNSSSANQNSLHFVILEVSLLYSQELAIYLIAELAEPCKFPSIPNILPCMPNSSELSYTKHFCAICTMCILIWLPKYYMMRLLKFLITQFFQPHVNFAPFRSISKTSKAYILLSMLDRMFWTCIKQHAKCVSVCFNFYVFE